MNISANELAVAAEVDLQFSHRAKRTNTAPSSTSRQNNTFRRRRSGPQQFNGIHRRRRKKIRW